MEVRVKFSGTRAIGSLPKQFSRKDSTISRVPATCMPTRFNPQHTVKKYCTGRQIKNEVEAGLPQVPASMSRLLYYPPSQHPSLLPPPLIPYYSFPICNPFHPITAPCFHHPTKLCLTVLPFGTCQPRKKLKSVLGTRKYMKV